MKQPDFVTIANGEDDVQTFDNWTAAQDAIWDFVTSNSEISFRMKRDGSHLWIEVA